MLHKILHSKLKRKYFVIKLKSILNDYYVSLFLKSSLMCEDICINDIILDEKGFFFFNLYLIVVVSFIFQIYVL